ncbi:MAG: type II secretion system F family protein [Armatimonadota bacterium]|nr:type II secretion system F family protein [Armatimonadota bacterium]
MGSGVPAFEYTGRDGIGLPVRGVLEADDETRARARLRERGLYITSLRPKARRGPFPWLQRRPTLDDVAAFTFHLAGLLASGVPLLRGLEVLREQTESRQLQEAIADLQASIEAGHSLSAGLARHPALFSPLYLGVVRVGEVAGVLDQSLARLSDYLERELALQQKIRMMLVYPTFVAALAAVVAGIFVTFVVPVFDRVYRTAGVPLPPPTVALVAISHLVRRFWPLLLAAAAAGAWALTQPRVRTRLREAAGRLLYRIPQVGSVARTIQVTRFVWTFGAMQASGVPVLSALDVTGEAIADPQMRAAIGHLRDGINRGRRLSEAMRSVTLFPPMVHRMVAMGEEAGRLDALLQRASDLLERETDFAIRRLMTLAEPLLTLALGGVVALILLALYLPIFGLPRLLVR